MIHVFSSSFKVEAHLVENFLWFMTDVVHLQVNTIDNINYFFTGLTQGYLSSNFEISLASALNLGLIRKEFTLINEDKDFPSVLIDFQVAMKKFIASEIQWFEVDLNSLEAFTIKLSPSKPVKERVINLNYDSNL